MASNDNNLTRGDWITRLEDLLQRRANAISRSNTSDERSDSIGNRANIALVVALNLEIEALLNQRPIAEDGESPSSTY